jgi:hypothetical protein
MVKRSCAVENKMRDGLVVPNKFKFLNVFFCSSSHRLVASSRNRDACVLMGFDIVAELTAFGSNRSVPQREI